MTLSQVGPSPAAHCLRAAQSYNQRKTEAWLFKDDLEGLDGKTTEIDSKMKISNTCI